MPVPESSLVAAVERMSRALEQLAAAPSVRRVLDEVVRSAVATLGAEQGSMSWWGEDGRLRTTITPGAPEDTVAACTALLLQQPPGTVEAPTPYVAEDLATDPLLSAEPGLRAQLGRMALVAMPVFLADERRVGVLVDWFRAPRALTEEEVRRFGLYARLASIALERERLGEVARRAGVRARAEAEQDEVLRLSRFQAVTEAFTRTLTREEVARAVLDLGIPAVGAVAGMVHMRTVEGRGAELMAVVGLAPWEAEPFRRLPLAGTLPGHDVARTGTAVWLESPEELRERYPELAAQRVMFPFQALAFLPLRTEGGVMGVLAFGFGSPRHFTAAERASIIGLARQCGLALERALLYERERAARVEAEAAGQRLRLLADASELLSSSLDWEETVAGVGRLALGPFADWCAVDALDEGQVRRLAVLHVDPAKASHARELMDYRPDPSRPSTIAEVLRMGKSRRVEITPQQLEAWTIDPRIRQLVREMGSSSTIITPLVARQRTLGTLTFVRGADRPPYDEKDQALAEELANRAALAMDNARLFREARVAEEDSRRSAARLHLLVRVDHLVAEAGLNLTQVLEVLAREVAEALGDACILQLVSEDGQWLELAAVHHPDATERAWLTAAVRTRRVGVGEGLQGVAVSSGQTLLLPSFDAEALDAGPEAQLRPYLERQGPQSLLVVPLVAHGRACGSLMVLRRARTRPYGRDDQVLLESIASRAALSIDDARLYAATLRALRQRDDFLSVAGHELKNPLNALQLQVHLLARMAREARSAEGLAERVERVARTSERLGLLIDDLLDVSRISTGQLQLQRSEVDLAALVSEGVSRMAEEFSRTGCEVRLEAFRPVVGAWDRLRMEQVVMNLLSNAAKYGKGRPVRVWVETVGEASARLCVADQGYGIRPEDQGRIFERFQRAESTRHIKGLGLGLWISRQIVEAHGGTLSVRSAPGEGATFCVELPRGVS